MRVGQIACAEGAELAIAEGKKLLATRGLGERRKLLQRGLGRSLRNRSDIEHFRPKLGTFWEFVNLRFLTIKSKK